MLPLKDDLKFMEDYIFLQKIRFGDNLQVETKLELDLNRMVIPLSIQMLVDGHRGSLRPAQGDPFR